jgi:hypothetical protein
LRSLDSSLESKINPYKLELSSPHLNLLLTMSVLIETSLISMKAAFLAAPEPIHGIPTLASLIDLMFHMCHCSQSQKTPASATMNMLFLAASSPDLYLYFTNKAHPSNYFPFPKEVDTVPDFSACTSDNERNNLKATHAYDQKP